MQIATLGKCSLAAGLLLVAGITWTAYSNAADDDTAAKNDIPVVLLVESDSNGSVATDGQPEAPTFTVEDESSTLLVAVLDDQDDMPTDEPADQPPFTIDEETTVLTEPLTEDGFVNYVAALNEQLSEGVTLENNAEVLYLEAMGAGDEANPVWLADYCELLGVEVPEAEDVWYVSLEEFAADHAREFERRGLPAIGDGRGMYDAAMAGPWTTSDYPVIAAWLEENAGALDLIQEAAARPKCYRPMVSQEDDMLLAVLLPTINRQREIVKMLAIRAMLRSGEGDHAAAWDDLHICYQVAQHTSEGSTLIDFLVGITVDSIASTAAVQLAQCEDLSTEDALKFADAISELQSLPPMIDRIDVAERYMYLDTVCYLSVHGWEGADALLGNGGGDLPEGLERLIARFAIDWDIVLSDGNIWYDGLVEAGRLETRAERAAAIEVVMEHLEAEQARISDPLTLVRIATNPNPREALSHLIASHFISYSMPTFSLVLDIENKATVNRDLARLAFVLAAYKEREMVYPDRLEQLVPDYLTEIPIDPFTGEPLGYRGNETGYLAYSVGPDLEDNTLVEESTLLDSGDDLRIHFHWDAE